ncbi:MAG: cell division protein ZapA [Longimonas sp.]|uniref:cell division protein ZapA n=1 Tax=Longimonas sp. TaxID=2039626 RepID=UPI00335B3EC8
MATNDMKPIRVHILGREYALRVREGEEETTRNLASQVNARMKAFQKEHPEQAEFTTSVITALAMAEELNDLRAALAERERELEQQEQAHAREREVHAQNEEALVQAITQLSERLADALPTEVEAPDSEPAMQEKSKREGAYGLTDEDGKAGVDDTEDPGTTSSDGSEHETESSNDDQSTEGREAATPPPTREGYESSFSPMSDGHIDADTPHPEPAIEPDSDSSESADRDESRR